jgi:hypothetical protein
MLAAPLNNILGAERVGFVEILPPTPDPGKRGDVKNNINPSTRFENRRSISDVTTDKLNAELGQLRIVTPAKRTDLIPASNKLFDYMTPQKAVGACDQCIQNKRSLSFLD